MKRKIDLTDSSSHYITSDTTNDSVQEDKKNKLCVCHNFIVFLKKIIKARRHMYSIQYIYHHVSAGPLLFLSTEPSNLNAYIRKVDVRWGCGVVWGRFFFVLFDCYPSGVVILFYKENFFIIPNCFGKLQKRVFGMSLLTWIYILSSISGVASLFIIGIYIRYKQIRSKLYNEIICNIAICDLMTAIGTLMGVPNDESVLCYIQSPLVNIGQVAQVFWVTLIAYYLHRIVTRSQVSGQLPPFELSKAVYVVCYGVPTLVSFLPLTTVPYGTIDGSWCYIVEGSKYKWTLSLWYIVSFFLWLIVAVLYYLYLFVILFRVLHQSSSTTVSESVRRSVHKIVWYPIALVVLYVPNCAWLLWLTLDPDANIALFGVISLLTLLLQGLFDSLVFIAGTPHAFNLLHEDWKHITMRITSRYDKPVSSGVLLRSSGAPHNSSNSSGTGVSSV
jgi:hypothetical protein